MQMAWEEVETERWFAEAQQAESDGDFDRATLLFVDTAHTERSGRFHRKATQALREAGRLLQGHYEDAIKTVATRSFLHQRRDPESVRIRRNENTRMAGKNLEERAETADPELGIPVHR